MEIYVKTKNLNELLNQANDFINSKMNGMTTSDRVQASRLGKEIILGINATYKKTKDPELMKIMKAVTEKKRKFEKRLKMRP